MPSWTEPILDELIIWLNVRKSSNYATPNWNNRIYLIPNLVENQTRGSTLHSMIRKQLSKFGQTLSDMSTPRPEGALPSLRYWDLKCGRLISPWYPVPDSGHQQLPYWTWHSWPESSHYIEYVMDASDSNIWQVNEWERGKRMSHVLLEWVDILDIGYVYGVMANEVPLKASASGGNYMYRHSLYQGHPLYMCANYH